MVTAPEAETSSRSCTELRTAALNRLVAVRVIVSLTPTLAPPGTATCASREAAPPYASGIGPVSNESPASRKPFPFQSRYRVTGHPRAETAATVKESAPFPVFVSACANTTALPGAPLLTRGGCRLTPATCPTGVATVLEATLYPLPEKMNARVAELEIDVPAGVPWASWAGSASVTCTLVAEVPPLLVTVKRYRMICPGVTLPETGVTPSSR